MFGPIGGIRIVEELFGDQLALVELRGPIERLLRLQELRRRLLDVGCPFDGRQAVRAGGAVFCQCALAYGVLFVGVVLQFLVVELDEHLSGGYAIAEIGQDPIHPARRLGGNRDLVVGGQRAHDLDVASNGLCFDGLDLDRLGLLRAPRRDLLAFRAAR